MSRYIPNENCWIGFSATLADPSAPTASEIGTAIDLTCDAISLNASATGNSVPTPQLCTLFETSINGTSSATFTADFYRDDTTDTAWDTLPRGTSGYFIIGRAGLTGTTAQGKPQPAATDVVEVWPVAVTSRSAGPITSNTAQMFTCTAAVPEEPYEAATVAA